ncbi:MAG: hypothetical protein WB579_08820 [Bryobacteraceae bacterium]
MTFPYPNRVQWAILWGAAITYLIVSDLNFLPALGGYDCDGHWMWPGELISNLPILGIFCLLLLWQFSKPVSLRSPILLPLGFVALCVGWTIVGAVLQHHRAESFTRFLQCH